MPDLRTTRIIPHYPELTPPKKFTEFRKEMENDTMSSFDRDEYTKASPEARKVVLNMLENRAPINIVDIPLEPFEPCDEVSIASSAVTVDLSIGFWAGNKHDKKASKEVTDANGAKKGMARVNKSLMGDNANLEAIKKFVANARNSNYAMTMPWGDVGQRLLPTVGIFDHRRVMGEDGERAQEFWRMVHEFLRVYDWKVTEAQAELGNLHNRDDYPSVDALRRKFHWSCRYVGLPTSGDWRVDVETEGREQLIREAQEYFKSNIEGAMSAVWKRV